MKKQEIIKYINMIVNFCINDCNAYLYVKCIPTIEKDNEEIPIGGGNFVILLSTLATIEFLATIDKFLDATDNDFYSKEDIELIKEKNKELKEENELFKNLLKEPEENDLKDGTGKLFRNFLNNTKDLTGITKKDAGKLQAVRNKLAHEFTPKIIPAATIPNIPGYNFVKLISEYHAMSVFTTDKENKEVIDSNALNHKLKPLLEYIIKKINSLPETDPKIKKLKHISKIQNS